MNFVRWLMKVMRKPAAHLAGCDAEGVQETVLIRYTLFRTGWGNIYLHLFERGDAAPELHDHPWPFVTLLL